MSPKINKSSQAPCRTAYDTEHELEFIDNLGTYSKKIGITREQLLTNYTIASNTRKRWGKIDLQTAQNHAVFAILEEQDPG